MSTACTQGVKFKGRLVEVRVADLRTNLFVRAALDDDRVYALLDLFLAGKDIEPIVVNKELEIIDGRHRRMMYLHADVEKVMVLMVDIDDPEELIAVAYKANTGGSLPPTRQDTEHTIAMLVSRGTASKRIADMLGLPPEMVRTYVKEVKAKMERRAIQDAIADIAAEGLTAQQAAEKHGVDLDKLKATISPKKNKERKAAVSDVKRYITTQRRSLSLKEQRIYTQVFEKLEDGEYTLAQAEEILEHFGQLIRRSVRTHDDNMARLRARTGVSADKAE